MQNVVWSIWFANPIFQFIALFAARAGKADGIKEYTQIWVQLCNSNFDLMFLSTAHEIVFIKQTKKYIWRV